MTKKLDLGNSKLAFGEANGEAMFRAESDFSEFIHMRGEILAEDENIIHKDKAEGQLTQNKVHPSLKGVPSIPSIPSCEPYVEEKTKGK